MAEHPMESTIMMNSINMRPYERIYNYTLNEWQIQDLIMIKSILNLVHALKAWDL
jgi:hypothetical protein